jgi:hypothetical protein
MLTGETISIHSMRPRWASYIYYILKVMSFAFNPFGAMTKVMGGGGNQGALHYIPGYNG